MSIREKSPPRAKKWGLSRIISEHPKELLVAKILLVFGVLFFVCVRSVDPDFGWHLASGGYYRLHGIPTHDIYTYTAHYFPWINHEWGNDVLVSYIYQLGGYVLLSVIYAALWTAALLINNSKARIGVVLISLAALISYAGVRPIAWTVFLLAILFKLCEAKSNRAKYYIPLLILFWVNLHAGFIVGLALIFYYAVSRWRQRSWWVILGISVLITMANPYGPHLYTELLRTLSDHKLAGEINEWRRAYYPSYAQPFMLLWAVGFWFYNRKKLKNWLRPQSFLVFASLMATRNVPLFVISAQKDLEHFFSELKNVFQTNLKRKSHLAITILTVCGVLIPLYSLGTWYHHSVNNSELKTTVPETIQYLKLRPCVGNLFNDYDLGGYLIWKLPGQKIFIDGRMPSWKDENGVSYYDRYVRILRDPAIRDKEFTRYNISCVLIDKGKKKFISGLENSGWKRVSKGNSVLLVNEAVR